MIALSATPIVGLPQFAGWSQVSENPPPSFARLVCAFAVRGEQAGNVGRTVAQIIGEKIIATGQELHSFLTELTEQVKAENAELFFAAALITKNKTFFAAHGGSILLKRDKKVGRVLQASDELHLVEGRHDAEDVCVLLTAQGALFIDEIEQKMLQGYDIDSIVTSVVPSIHAQEDSSLSAIAFVTERAASLLSDDASASDTLLAIEIGVGDEMPDEPASDNADIGPVILHPVSVSASPDSPTRQPGSGRRMMATVLLKLWALIVLIARGLVALVMALVGRMRKVQPASPPASPLLEKKKVYLTSLRKPSALRLMLFVGAVLLVAAGVIAWNVRAFRLRSQAARESMATYVQLIDQLRQQFGSDPLRVRQQVSQAIAAVEQREREEAGDRAALPEVQKVLSALRAYQEEISGQDELTELPVFYDLRLVSSDFVAVKVDGWEESLVGDDGQEQSIPENSLENQARAVFLDAGQNKVILLDLVSKKVRLFDVSSAGTTKDVRLTDSQVVLLADGLHALPAAIEGGDIPTPTQAIELGDSNRAGTLLGTFGTYVYVFNPEKRNLYRYSQQADGRYSEPIGWLQSTLGVQFEDVASLSLDGDVWLGTKTGEVRKYTRGVAVPFQVEGMPQAFDSPIELASSPNSRYLYVLEPARDRLVIINKADGAFVREVRSSSLASATGLFVSERLHKVFAVSGSIVFEVGI